VIYVHWIDMRDQTRQATDGPFDFVEMSCGELRGPGGEQLGGLGKNCLWFRLGDDQSGWTDFVIDGNEVRE